MKKIVLLINIFIMFLCNAFAREFIVNAGVNYSIYQEFTTLSDKSTYSTSLNGFGLDLGFVTFKSEESKIGPWANLNINFETMMYTSFGTGDYVELNTTNSDFSCLVIEPSLGVSFRFLLNEDFTLFCNTGLRASLFNNKYRVLTDGEYILHYGINSTLGIVADPEISYSLSEKWAVNLGCRLGFDFLSLAQITNTDTYDFYGLLTVIPNITILYKF